MERDPSRRRRPEGARSHKTILDAATRLASVDGIQGITIGRLANDLDISKSGLYAHFDSKLDLQQQTIRAAAEVFEREVIRRGMEAAPGLERIESLCEAYLSYVERRVFPGGCFFVGVLAEADAQTGPVHDAIESLMGDWMRLLESVAREAQDLGQIAGDADPGQIAFELEAALDLANCFFLLFGDPEQLMRGRRAVRRILDASLVAR